MDEIDSGNIENTPAPKIAIDYWNLSKFAKLRDVIIAVREDEMGHRDVNHEFVSILDNEITNKNLIGTKELKSKK